MPHHRPRLRPLLAGSLWIAISLLLRPARGHEHHDDAIPEGEGVSAEPIDAILWTHILLQAFAWGILMPTGMVLGVWHLWAWLARLSFGRRWLTFEILDNQVAMACTSANLRVRLRHRWLFPRPCA